MSAAKIAITMDGSLVRKIDTLGRRKVFANRSRAIQEAVREKMERYDRTRLSRECRKLDPKYEQALADEGLSSEVAEWPEY